MGGGKQSKCPICKGIFSRRNSEFPILAFLLRLRLRSSAVWYFPYNSQFWRLFLTFYSSLELFQRAFQSVFAHLIWLRRWNDIRFLSSRVRLQTTRDYQDTFGSTSHSSLSSSYFQSLGSEPQRFRLDMPSSYTRHASTRQRRTYVALIFVKLWMGGPTQIKLNNTKIQLEATRIIL